MLLITIALLAVTSLAQTSPPPSPSSHPPASTSVAAALPLFEVAAIELNKSGSGSSHSSTNNGRFTATNVSLKNLMQSEAYEIPGNRILDGPKWLDSTRFDIEAEMDIENPKNRVSAACLAPATFTWQGKKTRG